MLAQHRTLLRRLMPVLVVAVATWTYVTCGFGGAFPRDDSLYALCAQRVADGYVPYQQVFDVTGPFGSMDSAVGILAARQAGLPDYRGVQVQGIVTSVLTVLAVYLLAQALTGSVLAGGLAAAAFLGFAGFIDQAATGHPKLLVTLAVTVAVLCMVSKRWLLAGIFVAVAALTWQVVALVGVAGLVAIYGGAEKRGRATLALVGGGVAVVAAVVGWFALHGSVGTLWEGAVLSLVYVGDRAAHLPFTWHFWRPLRYSFGSYNSSVTVGWLGLIGIGAVFVEQMRTEGGPWKALVGSRWASFFCAFTLLTAFTVYDFQSPDDAFVLLPFLAVGLSYILIRAIDALTGPETLIRPRWRPIAAGLVAVALLMPTVMKVKFHPAEGLAEQRQAVDQIIARLGDGRIQCINTPGVLMLGELENATRHVVVGQGILSFIDAHEPGGVAGWIESIEDADVELVVENTRNSGRLPMIHQWIEANYRFWREYGDWAVYERPNVPSPDSAPN